jgi:SAM-dependent methyltransferase
MESGEDPIAEAAYDELADAYAAEVRTNPYNADLEFPATTSLIPEVEGKRVLDAGCGTGVYTEWLVDHGAEVVGVDVSEAMLEHARERVGDRAELVRADLAEPMEFAATDSFDGVVSALALGYVADWRTPFAEFVRLLKPGGFLVFSTGHPLDQFPPGDDEGEANYFEVERAVKEWDVEVPYYRRPFSEVVEPLLETGFRIDRVLEPRPTAAFEEKWPERYEKESRYPVFLCVRAVRE